MTLPARPLREALALCASPLTAAEAATGAGHGRRTYLFPASALVFAGHFPGHPVLPAVVQTLMAQMTVEDALASIRPNDALAHSRPNDAQAHSGPRGQLPRPLRLLAVTQAKFTAVLGPDTPITVDVRPAAKADHWDCTLHARTAPHEDATLAAKIQLHLEQDNAAREVNA